MTGEFFNIYERITYDKLDAAIKPHGAHVFAKVRLKDIIPVNNSGISDHEFSFALKAHVDFLITDSDQIPQFCVEYDGANHQEQRQKNRDAIKDSLFDRFDMPFLRINSRHLAKRYRSLDLLTYFVDTWFMRRYFIEAQDAGQIPGDEIFDPAFVLSRGEATENIFPYWLSFNHDADIQKLYTAGRVRQPAVSSWIGVDTKGNLHCICWLLVERERCLIVETAMRSHRFPVALSDVLSQIATSELAERLSLYLEGNDCCCHNVAYLKDRIDCYQRGYQLYSFSGIGDVA
jgi:hypothetical protein